MKYETICPNCDKWFTSGPHYAIDHLNESPKCKQFHEMKRRLQTLANNIDRATHILKSCSGKWGDEVIEEALKELEQNK